MFDLVAAPPHFLPRRSVLVSSSMKPPAAQALAGSAADRVILDDRSKTSTRRLTGGNGTTPVEGLRRFFRWSDNGKLSKKETSKWQAKPRWAKLTEWMATDSK